MRNFLFALLLLPLLAASQTVTFPAPGSIATKQYVDSLVTKRLENLGGAEKPEDKPCKAGIELRSITEVSEIGLTYQFHSEGVKQLRETIRNADGVVVWTGFTKPTWNTIKLRFPTQTLTTGVYKLTISNTECSAEATREFAVEAPGTVEPGEPGNPGGQTGFVNPGVFSEKVGTTLYEWIPSEGVEVAVTGEGKIRLISPETKPSWSGKNTCRRFLFGDLYFNRIPENEEHALFGEGLLLPPGNYAFTIVYLDAPDWETARGNLWSYIGMGAGGGLDHSARMENVYLSVSDGQPVAGVDANYFRASWIPQYQLLPYALKLPENKVFGVTRYINTLPPDTLFKKFTHLQYAYSWITDFSRAWKNLQAYDGNGKLIQPDFLVEHAILDKNYILMSEAAENYGNLEGDCPRCYLKVEDAYRRIYERFVREQGVTSPAQTWLVSDYFSHLYGGSVGVDFNTLPAKVLSRGLSSVEIARSRYFDNEWYLSGYFSQGWHAYRNYLLEGYLPNFLGMAGLSQFYGSIYNIEKANLAIPDRKKLRYGTIIGEGLGIDLLTSSGVFNRLKLPGGEILRLASPTYPLHTMMAESFYQLLLADGYLLWDSNIPVNTNPETFRESWYGGHDTWKTRWRPAGGPTEDYTGQSGQPAQVPTDDRSQFPEQVMQGDQGAWLGAYLYSTISTKSDRVSKWVSYCEYEFNQKRIKPRKGEHGALVSYNGLQNPGQDNSVKNRENALPVCLCTEGKDGKAVIFQNPHAGLTERQLLTVEGNTWEVTGNRLSIFTL